ncbi:glycine zipper domain-containing protein [Caulobacter mirabilis]|uniref:Uncharacterized protein n=1 Tax=Caulobacter mirabilis TaxID=69666 RepID=A0A2D2AV58_9CAUL|nr:glycine zipper domain-containing protein [Caulobacter mirabilis]ATQ41878.1 hypothetical protein CSW64_05345 [Caulobacter mirabilis]
MKTKIIAAATVGVMLLSTGAAVAQGYPPSWDQYRAQQDQYQRQRDSYQDRRDDYDAQRRAYEDRRAQWMRDQADYDRRYGRGAYVRQYGDWRYDDPYYQNDRYDDRYSNNDYYNNDYYGQYRNSPCERNKNDRTAVGAVIGALAGAALGSNAAARNAKSEGAVLGALVGGGLGGTIGRSSAKCDNDGYWYSRDQTLSYRESGYGYGERSGRYGYDDYRRRGCRLAQAPTNAYGQAEYRYVRVCPDSRGRYRITE